MRKVLIWLFTILAVLLFSCALGENLLENPDFSLLNEDGTPVGWHTEAWLTERSVFMPETLADGTTCVSINNMDYNDAGYVQIVPVKENTCYKFTCRIMATGADPIDRIGACISFIDTHVYSDALYDTNGEWKTVTFYGKTVSGQTSIKVAARLGGYSFDNIGFARFTDFTMEEVPYETVAALGLFPVSLKTNAPFQQDHAGFEDFTFGAEAETPPARNTETHIFISYLTLLLFLYLIQSLRKAPESPLRKENRLRQLIPFALLLAIGLLARIYLALRFRGYAVDVTNFMLWGASFFEKGPAFYAQSGLHDYPPLYMLVLGLADLARRILGIGFDTEAHQLLIKLTPIFCDLLFACMVYALFRKKSGQKWALVLSGVILLNPAYMINSAAWGQVDSVLALFVVLVVYFAMQRKWELALALFAVSMLLKPQALLFGPLGLCALAFDAWQCRQNRQYLLRMLRAVLIALAVLYFCAFPFAVYESTQAGSGFFGAILSPVSWLISLYTGTASGYSSVTVNALNLYQLFDLNWVSLAQEPTFKVFSWFMMLAGYAYCAFLMLFSKSVRSLPLAGAVLISVIFCFGPMMHERYLFPALALLLIAFLEHKDKRLIYVFVLFTLTQYLNQALVLQCGMSKVYTNMGHLSGEESFLNKLISCFNLFGALYLAFTAFDILVRKKASPFKAEPARTPAGREALLEKKDHRLNLTRGDFITIACVTVLYAAFAFWNLGALKSPQSAYSNQSYKEQVVFDLGEEKTFRMTYFGGISSSSFTVSLSNDGETWSEENYAVYGDGEIFRWHWYVPKKYTGGVFADAVTPYAEASLPEAGAVVNYATQFNPYPLQSARYIRFTYMGANLPLHEVGFWDVKNEALYEVINVYGTEENADYHRLIDEQDTIPFAPSYYNSFYFDEIYHARTAYEFIHGLPVYEWSHPHLGKILIMLGIEIFGMTPFGWRFMGTLFGALMLPAMYLLVRQLTKNRWAALFGMLFLAFDSMHFTQSRIATVDTYAVFFIMLMYFFMFRYLQMNMNSDPLEKTLVPLGLSGLFFALGCASKWIGIYAGAGLAVLFFSGMYLRFREYLNARALCAAASRKGQKYQTDREISLLVAEYPQKLVCTLLFCVCAFILVPIAVYFLTYYWHYAPTDNFTLKNVWELQKSIFGYHNGLSGDTHSFRSPWYEWPTIVRPMWYYSADTAYTGLGVVSSISCMGNPAVWWTGLVAIMLVPMLNALSKKPDRNLFLITVGFASQFLPWLLISRSTFIYHYFASVPFIILASAYLLDQLRRIDRYAFFTLAASLVLLACILFFMFYPLESGYPCAYDYALRLRWFNWVNFALQ